LAACLAARGNEVALVDADLRASAGPRCVTAAGPGTADAIARRVPIANFLSPGDCEHLAVIPCGDALLADQAALRLGQQDTARLLSDVAVQGRRMILDLPPASEDEGAFEAACHASAVIISTRHGTTERRRLGELVKRLQARGVRIAGAVIVDVPAERQHPYAGPTPLMIARAQWQRLSRLVRRSPAHA
jgi:Mrp family chromosome partitioning ATPase